MSVERRGQVIRVPITLVNWQQEEPTDRGEGRQLFLDDTSRVSREAQARFREGLGVQFPGATRPILICRKSGVHALEAFEAIASRMGFTINREKTRITKSCLERV